MPYVKVKFNDIAYYISQQHIGTCEFTVLDLTAHASFVVSCQDNTLIKCRDNLETILDNYTKES